MREKTKRYGYVIVRRVQDCISGDIIERLYRDCTIKQAVSSFNKCRLNLEWDSIPFKDAYCVYADNVDPKIAGFSSSSFSDGWSIPEFTKHNY